MPIASKNINAEKIQGNLDITSVSASAFTGSFIGDGAGLYNLPTQSFDTGSLVTTASFNSFTASYTTGSFTGSFAGDGSQLTGTSKWTGSNPISRQSDVTITGSLRTRNTAGSGINTALGQLLYGDTASVDWRNHYLKDQNNITSIDWHLRKGNDSYETRSINWSSRGMWDENDTVSVDWTVRQLIKSDESTITVDWENGLFTGSLFGTASWSNFAITASYILNAISSSYAINAATASNILGGKATHVPYFITDTTLATSSIFQSGSTSIIINQDNNTTANPEALYVWQPSTSSINVISGKGNLNNYLQLNIQNTNQGASASSDVVATANNGNETTNYIDMGINSENYNAGFVGDANDAYLYSTGNHLHIGNVSNFPVQIFAGGSDVDIHNKLELSPNNQHMMSGSLDVSGSIKAFSFTGSLQGNATSATTSQTSSYSTTLGASLSQPANNQVRLLNSAGGTLSTVTVNNVISASHASNSATANYATIAGNGGVTQIIAGSGITLLPPVGQGAVTVIASAGGGVTIISGSLVTGSFVNTTSYTFNHDLSTRTPIITVFDSNYNQIIPENIQLVDTASAIITFPTAESGFAIGSTGGTTGTALSSSYAQFSTYADTASYFAETDPVFVAKSGSFATTGSNSFNGNQIITGSLIVSSSNTITVIGPMIITGSLLVSGSTTQIGNNTLTGNTSLTGSINVSGSQTFVGNQYLTGSFVVTGSTTQIGNNTLTGNTVLSGSISVSGSQTFVGNQYLTGSFLVSGSTTQIGNNTLSGNTSLSGSITISGSTTNMIIGNTQVYGQFNVSGSSTFSDSTFTITGSQYFTGSSFITGNQTLTGNSIISGTLDVLGNINVISGSAFTRWGNKLFNYGAFSDYTTQSGSAATAHPIKLNTTDVALGIYLSGSSPMKIENTGIYNFQWSGQLNQGAGASVVSVWLRVNGVDVPGSRGDVTLASNDDALPSWNYVLSFNANDAIELYWSSTSANTRWVFSPIAITPPRPSTASLIATITQIA